MLRRASNGYPQFVDRIGTMKMSALLSRTASSRPGITGPARVDRDIERLLRRARARDTRLLGALAFGPVTPGALGPRRVAAGANAPPSVSRPAPHPPPQ